MLDFMDHLVLHKFGVFVSSNAAVIKTSAKT